jgi:hypothetical protein
MVTSKSIGPIRSTDIRKELLTLDLAGLRLEMKRRGWDSHDRVTRMG